LEFYTQLLMNFYVMIFIYFILLKSLTLDQVIDEACKSKKCTKDAISVIEEAKK